MAETIILADYLHSFNDLRNKQVSYGGDVCFPEIEGPWINDRKTFREQLHSFVYTRLWPLHTTEKKIWFFRNNFRHISFQLFFKFLNYYAFYKSFFYSVCKIKTYRRDRGFALKSFLFFLLGMTNLFGTLGWRTAQFIFE